MRWLSRKTDISEWHLWYAWHPVTIQRWSESDKDREILSRCWVWGEFVWRRFDYQTASWSTIRGLGDGEDETT